MYICSYNKYTDLNLNWFTFMMTSKLGHGDLYHNLQCNVIMLIHAYTVTQ